jgi:lipoprotein NlpI
MRNSVLIVSVIALFAAAGPLVVSQAVADDAATCNRVSSDEALGDEAIAACTRVIQAQATSVRDRAEAHNSRGWEYYIAKGDFDRAIADYTEAVRLDSTYALAYNDRGNAYLAKGDFNRAIADYNESIRLDPKDARFYQNRGFAYFNTDALPKALADFSRASELDPKDAYNALAVDMLGQRSKVSSRLLQAITNIDMTVWPAPILRMFLGQLTPAAVLAAADDPDAKKKKAQVCEADFYSGELALRTGAKDEAIRLFRLAASDCGKLDLERRAANAELKALGVAQ